MDPREQATATAINLGRQAAELLDAVGDRAGSLRLRHVVAYIANDAMYAPHTRKFAVPLSLMQMALALIDNGGFDCSGTAIHLQSAIDRARGASVLPDKSGFDIELLPSSCPDVSQANGTL